MRERLAEDAEALGLASRAAVNLGLLDGQYRSSGQSAEAVAERLTAVVDRSTVLYAPADLGAIADHGVVRAAAIALEARGYAVTFYADLPHAIRFGWPARPRRGRPRARQGDRRPFRPRAPLRARQAQVR